MQRWHLFFFSWLVMTHSPWVQAVELRLGTNITSAEAYSDNAGGTIAQLECILDELGYTFSVQQMPWRRARREVSRGNLDGFFPSAPAPSVDRYATRSDPLVLQHWYWFWRQEQDLPDTWRRSYRLGTILGSNQYAWLKQNEYPVHIEVGNLEQLLKLMVNGRIDAFIADRDRLESTAEALGISDQAYNQRFLRYAPLGAYFANDFLVEHPGFLREFNQHIYDCAPEGFEMSAGERRRVRDWLAPVVEQWLSELPIQETVLRQNRRHRRITQGEIHALDQRWMEEFQAGEHQFAAEILDKKLSQELRARVQGLGEQVTEVILTDEQGLNVAISHMTSGYWRGDADKFLKAWELGPGEYHFSPVIYDRSSRRFQVDVSRPLFHPHSGRPIGVLIVGVDVEQILSLNQ